MPMSVGSTNSLAPPAASYLLLKNSTVGLVGSTQSSLRRSALKKASSLCGSTHFSPFESLEEAAS